MEARPKGAGAVRKVLVVVMLDDDGMEPTGVVFEFGGWREAESVGRGLLRAENVRRVEVVEGMKRRGLVAKSKWN